MYSRNSEINWKRLWKWNHLTSLKQKFELKVWRIGENAEDAKSQTSSGMIKRSKPVNLRWV